MSTPSLHKESTDSDKNAVLNFNSYIASYSEYEGTVNMLSFIKE